MKSRGPVRRALLVSTNDTTEKRGLRYATWRLVNGEFPSPFTDLP
jgi:hypothetical protein